MIDIRYHSGIYTLTAEQFLPVTIEEAWGFFSNPANLCRITPTHMGFEITSGTLAKMYAGQIISYRVSPFPRVKVNWVTEITQVSEPNYFVDEQRFGPYCLWHHEHHFEQVRGGVLMHDKVSYKLPAGPLGKLAHKWFVMKKLQNIFNHRFTVLEHIFRSNTPDNERLKTN